MDEFLRLRKYLINEIDKLIISIETAIGEERFIKMKYLSQLKKIM